MLCRKHFRVVVLKYFLKQFLVGSYFWFCKEVHGKTKRAIHTPQVGEYLYLSWTRLFNLSAHFFSFQIGLRIREREREKERERERERREREREREKERGDGRIKEEKERERQRERERAGEREKWKILNIIEIARGAFNSMLKTKTARYISMKTRKIILKEYYVWSTLSYGCETWTISTRNVTKLQSFEMWAYRKMMKIS